jgi:putative adenylate-forming enzyme
MAHLPLADLHDCGRSCDVNITTLASVLRTRAVLRSHDHWSRDELLTHQARALAKLRTFAVGRSPFYREFHRGFESAPLDALPILTKATLMERFDELVTDRGVRLADVERHVETATATARFRNRYRVAATGGTTGRRGVFLSAPAEWTMLVASYARAYQWAGIEAGLTHRLRMAVISSRNPTHQSSIVGATVASRFVPTLRLDATEPIADIVRQLNDFRPDSLVGYASMLRLVAEQQLAGSLAITPRAVMSASEVLTDDTRERIRRAFGVNATNVYAATETGGIASECRRGHLHRYEDLVIAEIVDAENRPVPVGDYGAKLLVTVLFSRTQPLIRYELSDRVAESSDDCPDGMPYALLAGIQGREEEVLTLAGVTVHPNVFHNVLDGVPVAGWQIIDEDGHLRVLLADARPDVDPKDVAARITAALTDIGARGIPVHVEAVDAIPRTALGKAPLVRRRQ